jgi:hypothetical protein
MRTILSRVLLIAVLFFVASPAGATDRRSWFTQQTVTATGLNQQERNDRLALGTWLLHSLDLTPTAGNGVFANLSTSPSSGLLVTVGPTAATTLGALYQVQQDDTAWPPACPGSISNCAQLPADPTLIAVAAFQAAASSQLGPLSPPVSSGQSVYWLVEGQVVPSQDTGSSSVPFVINVGGPSPIYVPQNMAVNLNRTDVATYQTKEGTASTANCSSVFPAKPSVDSGWIAVSWVCVPFGTSTITTGMISPDLGQFTGFTAAGGNLSALSVKQVGTNVTGGWINNGQLGQASAAVLRFGNATSGSAYTSLGAANDGTCGSVQNSLLSIGNTGTREICADGSGDLGVAGSLHGTSLAVDGASAPSTGFACGNASNDCTFASHAGTSGPGSAYYFAGPCSGTNLDVMQFANVSTLESWIGCDGSFNQGILSGTSYGMALGASSPGIICNACILEAMADHNSPGAIPSGSFATETSSVSGSIQFGSNVVGGSLCGFSMLSGVFNLGCPTTNSGYFQADGTGGASLPTVASGDLSADESATCGKLFLGGSSSSGSLGYGCATAGVFRFSNPLTVPKLLQTATNDFAGTCTNSSSTTCTATLVSAYTTPLCFVTDQSSTNKVDATCTAASTTVTVTLAPTDFNGSCAMSAATTCTITTPYAFGSSYTCVSAQATTTATINSNCQISATTITVTASISNSDTWGVILRGVPTATSHVFSYHIVPNPN